MVFVKADPPARTSPHRLYIYSVPGCVLLLRSSAALFSASRSSCTSFIIPIPTLNTLSFQSGLLIRLGLIKCLCAESERTRCLLPVHARTTLRARVVTRARPCTHVWLSPSQSVSWEHISVNTGLANDHPGSVAAVISPSLINSS